MYVRSSRICLGIVALLGLTVAVCAHATPRSDEDRAIQRAAVAAAELEPARTRSLRLRLHLAPLLPQLRVTFGRGWQLTTSRDFLLDTPTVDNDRVNYAISAHWDLARLLVPHEELQLAKEETRRAMLRLRLEERVAQLLAERCWLLRGNGARSQSDEQRRLAIEATLTVITGGQPLPPLEKDVGCSVAPLRDSATLRSPVGAKATTSTPDPRRAPSDAALDPGEPSDGISPEE